MSTQDADAQQLKWWQSIADPAEASTPAGADDEDDEAAANGVAKATCLCTT